MSMGHTVAVKAIEGVKALVKCMQDFEAQH